MYCMPKCFIKNKPQNVILITTTIHWKTDMLLPHSTLKREPYLLRSSVKAKTISGTGRNLKKSHPSLPSGLLSSRRSGWTAKLILQTRPSWKGCKRLEFCSVTMLLIVPCFTKLPQGEIQHGLGQQHTVLGRPAPADWDVDDYSRK